MGRVLSPRVVLRLALWVSLGCLAPMTVSAQERSGYLQGEHQGLEMIVHIMGEVQKPGEYRVADHTNLLELLANAGGPTQFSKLGVVSIRRVPTWIAPENTSGAPAPRPSILRVDVNELLHDANIAAPALQPGDVVFVPKNSWSTWKDVASVMRDISVVASAYFLYLNAVKD